MKTQRTILAFIVILSMLLTNVSTVYALPPLPSTISGTVKVDGVNVPAGTSITAWIGGVQYASTIVTTYLGDTVYSLDVPGDDSATPAVVEGGVEGNTIVFHIGGLVAVETGTWHSGVPATLNLTNPGYTLTVTSAHGTVTKLPDEPYYHDGDVVQLTAVPSSGWSFSNWSDGATGTANPVNVTIHANTSVTANYSATSVPTGLTCTNLNPKPATASTGEKPQSKVWTYGGSWYAVFPTNASGASSAGTWVWKLVGTTWTEVVKISTRTDTKADVLVDGTLAHILLWADSNTQFSSIEYVSGAYQLWATRPSLVSISLPGSEIATIAKDSTGKIWLSTRTNTGEIVVYHSNSPYSTWNGPIVLESGVVANDDLSVITALPNGTIGVFWGNENPSVKKFGFRYHVDGANVNTWSVNEVPAEQSYVDGIGTGMADDHMNVAVASDSTLYVAIKTSYDTAGYPRMALLVRRPSGTNGTWDDIYPVDEAGTRPIVLLDEVHGILSFIYTSSEGYNPIVYQQSSTASIDFDGRKTLRSSSFNDVSSMKGNYDTGFVVIYSSASEVGGQYCSPTGATGADLSITKTDGQVTVKPNDPITYTITATNSGPQAVTGATVVDTMPAALTGVSWTCAGSGGGTCPASGTGNINNTVNLPMGASVIFTVAATIANSAAGSLVNTATITPPGGVTDPALTNNSATDTDTITILETPCETDPTLVGCWQMEENGGSALVDGSSFSNDAVLYGAPAWAAGKVGSYALDLNGTSQYGLVADDASLDIANQITIAAWIKPEQYATQDLIKKSTNGSVDGYELTLATTKTDASSQRVFFRINQATNGDTYRINATTMYPTDGTWMHAAATYDGTTMRLYINGVLESSLTPPGGTTIAVNNVPLSIGAQSDVQRFYMGWIDDARVYNRALSQSEIEELAGITANNPPVITESDPQAVTMSEDGSPTAFSKTLNATDVDGDTLTWSISGAASHGTATASGTGLSKAIGYTPAANYNGSDSFVVQVSDGNGGTDTITINVTINAVNDAPVITESDPQTVTMSEDGVPTAFSKTLNATDVDSATLTWSISGAATHGTATASGTGLSKAIGYTPTADYNGSDSFVVQVSDGSLTDTITVNVTINAVNDAPVITESDPQAVTMSEDGAPTAFSKTLNATDVDSPTLTWSISSAASHGTATASGTGLSKAIGYTPTADYFGSDSFVVQVSDGSLTDTITVNVTINAVNDAPVITEGTSVPVSMSKNGTPTAFALTLHATDVDSATLTWSISSAATHGTATASGPGLSKAIGYTPTTDYVGSDSFVVQVSDGSLTDTITVNVTIGGANNAPVITESDPQAVTMSEDGVPTAFSKTLNATDVDGDTLTWSISGAATHGTATASGTGSSKAIGYTPTANYNGSDSFVVQVSDGSLTDTITVNVTINAVNDPPVITESDPQAVTMSEDGAPTAFSKTLNATDVDGDTLTWSISGAASHGTAAASGTGLSKAIGYTPTANYNGSDSFVVQVSDGSLTDTITVNVTINAVNDPPVITESDPQAVTMSEDGVPTAFSKTLNATDVDSPTLTWSISSAASHGTATASGTGLSKAIGYTPTADYFGSDSFVVQVSDGSLTDTITINVTINAVNDAPVITEGTSVPVSMSKNGTPTAFALTLNATDVDSPTLTWSISGAASHGIATASGTGLSKAIGYTPTTDYVGSDSFVVQVSDGSLTDTITVNVTIGGANNPPVITETDPVSIEMSEDGSPTPFGLTLHATDADVSDTLTWSISNAASHGTATASGTGPSKAIGYTPATDYYGSDSFIVQVSDGTDADTVTVNVTISYVNDTPVITGQVPLSTNMDTELTIYVTDITIFDPDNTYPSDFYLMVLDGTNYTHVGATITPALGYTGTLTVPVAVNDGNSTSDPYDLTVTVNSVNTFTLSVSKTGSGTGTITSDLAGINCGVDCDQSYNEGIIVTLTATPTSANHRFLGWTGGGCSGIGVCFVTMNAAKAVSAEFEQSTFTDVPFSHPRWAYIESLWDNGFTAGCQLAGDPLKFCPEDTMLRTESSVFMLRGKLGSIGTPTDAEPYVFGDDWSGTEWAIPWAEKMWDEGMTAGCQYPAEANPKLFCPWTQFTRDMGAVFALRIKHGSDMPIPVGTGTVFADMTDLISSDGIGVGWAEQAYSEGLIPNCGIDPISSKPKFCPFDQLDRSWSAYMIVLAKGLTLPE